MGQWMDGFVSRLEDIRKSGIESGGEFGNEFQQNRDKLTIRDRLNKLLDSGSFQQLGTLVVEQQDVTLDKQKIKTNSPCDGIVMGYGKVNGRNVAVYGMDFNVMSGTIGDQGAWMIADIVTKAGKMQIPLIAIYDTAGMRGSFVKGRPGYDGIGRILKAHSLNSRVIPQIGLLLGPCTGMMAYVPLLCHFLIMNDKTGFLWMGGEKTGDEAGKADFQMQKAGQCDFLVNSDEEAIETAKNILKYLPQNCWDNPPLLENDDPVERADEDILTVMPNDPRHTYDVHEIIEKIIDKGSFLEFKDDYAIHFVTGLCTFGGRIAGVVANNSDELSGIFEPDSSDKYDRFMTFLDTFNIPLITLSDTTAFAPGDSWERKGILRHGAKLLHTYSRFTAPKITIVLRRSYGGGNIVMGAIGMAPDFIYAWPTGEFAPAGPASVVQVIFHKELAAAREAGNYDEVHDKLLAQLVEEFSVMTCAKLYTSLYTVNEVIDPRETRARICKGLELLENKAEKLPKNRRSIKPA